MKGEMLEKTYSPSSFEEKHYKAWMEGGYFDPKPGEKGTFSVVIPVTGLLALLRTRITQTCSVPRPAIP